MELNFDKKNLNEKVLRRKCEEKTLHGKLKNFG